MGRPVNDTVPTNKLEALLEAAVDTIITIDRNGLIQSVNRSATILFGYERDHFLGQNIKFLMPEPWSSAHDGYLKNYQKTGKKKIIGSGREVEGLKADGSVFPMHLSVSEFTASGETFYTGIIHDFTKRKQAENALQRAQKMESIGQLTGGIAHDFNNLLTIIIGNLELLDMRIQDDFQKSLVSEANEAAELGADLTARLLTFARRSVLKAEVMDLNELVKNTRNMLSRTIGESVLIETSLDTDLWEALVDPGQVESVVINLAVNARDAMPNGGRLLVETKNFSVDQEYTEAEIGLKFGDYVCLSVSDSGTGMSEEVVANAFEPFFTTKEVGRGSGLGLSMVYGFAKQSGGHVTLYSELNLGTTINLYLPRYEGNKSASTPSLSDDQDIAYGNGETILVVEDNMKVQNITVQRVENLNYQVITANNGEAAKEVLDSNNSIDFVFTDLIMPGALSGYDLVNYISENYPHIPVLMTSGYAEDLLENGKLEKLGIDLLRKPYRQAKLAQMLFQTLAKNIKN